MDSSRLSASFSRAERSATAANSARRNSCWKSMIPRWPDSPPGTSMLWSSTAKTPSDSSVSNKVRFSSFHTNFSRISHIFSPRKTVSFFTRFCVLTAGLLSPLCSVLYTNYSEKINFYVLFIVVISLLNLHIIFFS